MLNVYFEHVKLSGMERLGVFTDLSVFRTCMETEFDKAFVDEALL